MYHRHFISRKFLALGLLALAVGSAWGAQQEGASGSREGRLAARFAAADTNHDGQLTRAEAEQGMPRLAQHFDALDPQGRGYVTEADIAAFVAKAKAQKR